MSNPVIDIIRRRNTINLFDPSGSIGDDLIAELVSLATRAPSSFHLQNWRFVAARSPEAKARLRAVAWNQAKVEEAAVTFIVCGQIADHALIAERLAPVVEAGIMPAAMVPGWEAAARTLYAGQPQRQRDEAVRTATLGAATLIHAATSLGLGTAPMIGFEPEGVIREFGLRMDEIPVMLLAVGHAKPENWPQKPRRPLPEVLELV